MAKDWSEADSDPQRTYGCWDCQHFGVTWEPAFPYMCKKIGFKSRILPCIEVKNSSERDCLSFDRKLRHIGERKARSCHSIGPSAE